MVKRHAFAQIALWLFVVSAGLVSGASTFEHLVLTPLWAGSLPESVRTWPHGGIQGAFFAPVTPLYGLFSLALALGCWWMPARQRSWSLLAGVSGVVVVAATIVFFLPILQKTQGTRGAGLSDAEIIRLVGQFQAWHIARWTLLVSGWLAGLRALSLSSAAAPEEAATV